MGLNDHQKDIVNYAKGKTAAVAGPGTGKTTTALELIEKLYREDKVPLEQMFITTFTNKAARDIKERLKKKFNFSPEQLNKLWIGTFHSLGFRYLTSIKKLKMNIVIPVEADYFMKTIFKKVVKEKNINEDLVSFDSVSETIEQFRNQNRIFDEKDPFLKVCKWVYDEFQKEKKEQNLLDFTDILCLFEEHLRLDEIFRKKFEWVMVDEAQDCNYYQFSIAELLTNKNSIFVGDAKQSLYKWRGATPELFKERIKAAGRVFPLSFNYRSSKEIVDFANMLVKQVPEFKSQEIIATKSYSGVKPSFTVCNDLAQQIYLSIKEDIRNRVPLDEIAVLSRSVKYVNIQNLLILLRRDRIPYTLRGGDDKLNATYIQNFLSLLKSLVQPTKISLVNTFSMLPGIGPKTAMTLAEEAVTKGIAVALNLNSGRATQTKAYSDFIRLTEVKDKKDTLLKSLEFLHDHYLVPKYSKKDLNEPSKKRTIVFDLLFNYLMGFNTISEGIDSLYVNEDDAASDKDKIVISTLHQSKGLEWDNVYIANVNEYALPYIKEDEEGDPSKLEEEFCLMYVGCTRAKNKLKMYMQFRVGLAFEARPNKISRFIKEIYRTTKENHFILRVLDVQNESMYKEIIYKKCCEQVSL